MTSRRVRHARALKRCARLLGLVLLATIGCTSRRGDESTPVDVPPPPPHDLFLTDDGVVGCYEVTSLEWDDPKARHPDDYAPPRRFRLRNILARPQSHTIVPRAPTRFELASWRITVANELEATWSTGMTHVTVTLRQRSTDGRFHGRAVTGGDGGGSFRRGTIELRKFECTG